MGQAESNERPIAEDEWAKRRTNNVRLGLFLGAVVFVLFLIALWKFRPI
jgi:hypothetical protein